MSRDDLRADILEAMVVIVLQRVENHIKSLHPDMSATGPEHSVGYLAGFRMAKRQMIDILDGIVSKP